MTTTENLRKAQQRVAEKCAQALAARPTGKPSAARGRSLPSATPRSERPSAPATAPPVLLSRDDLREHYGITYSRQHLHRLIREGCFPQTVSLGDPGQLSARKVWKREDVERWVANLSYINSLNENAAAE
jgi:predicted DNA-binding transcriptional regulator AlpA